jgi:phosphatidylglycerol:prolipoprotein diacylglycerol transferase
MNPDLGAHLHYNLDVPIALISWFVLPSLSLGPFTLQSFGLLSAAGILVGMQVAAREAKRDGLDPRVVLDFSVIAVAGGLLGGHLVHLLFYHPEELADPVRILKFWEGLSSMGGLAGAMVTAAIWFRRRRLRFGPFGDAWALGLAPGWGIARLGCFSIHDHPGVRSDFFLAVDFPGGPRHDLGLYEAILLFALAALLFTLRRRGQLKGLLLPLLGLLYGVGRFLLDFLRARPGDLVYADGRQLGLTFAQWFAMGLVAWGITRLARRQAPGER